MKITGRIRATCPQCEERRLDISADTETKEILLKCLYCGHEENIMEVIRRLSTGTGSVDLLSQVDEVIKGGLSTEEKNPFGLDTLADRGIY